MTRSSSWPSYKRVADDLADRDISGKPANVLAHSAAPTCEPRGVAQFPSSVKSPGDAATQPGLEATGARSAPAGQPVSAARVLLLVCVGAAGLGLLGQAAVHGTFRGSWELSRLGGPWLVAAFVGGAVAGWRRRGSGLVLGAAAGAIIVSAGTVSYYVVSYWVGGYGAGYAATMGIGWGLAGIVVGGALGLLGAGYTTELARHRAARSGRLVASWLQGAALGTLGGLLIGEAIALLWIWDNADLRAMATLEALGGAALVLFGSLGRNWRFVIAAVTAAAVAATIAPMLASLLRETLRAIGWVGA